MMTDNFNKVLSIFINFKLVNILENKEIVAHWLEHWIHDHRAVGSGPDSSSMCRVPEQGSSTLFLLTQVKKEGKTDLFVQEK